MTNSLSKMLMDPLTDSSDSEGEEEIIEQGVADPPTDEDEFIQSFRDRTDVNAFGDADRHGYFLISLFEDTSKGTIPKGMMHPREILGSKVFNAAKAKGCMVFCEELSTNGGHHCHLFYKGPRLSRTQIKDTCTKEGYMVRSQELYEIQPIPVNRGPLGKKSKYEVAKALRYCTEGYKSKKTQLDGFNYQTYGLMFGQQPATWANKVIADYNKEAERIKEREAKKAAKEDKGESVSLDDALDHLEQCIPDLQLWMDKHYVYRCLVIQSPDDELLRRSLDKYKSKIMDAIDNRLSALEPVDRLNEGFILLCGAARTGKSTFARNYVQDRWGKTAEFAGAPKSAMAHHESWTGAGRGFWDYNGQPAIIVDEVDKNSLALNKFKMLTDMGNSGSNHYFSLERKNGSSIYANHSVAIMTTNAYPTRLYSKMFAEDEGHWMAFRDRINKCYWSPYYRIKDGFDFSDLEEGPDGEKVRNTVELNDDREVVRDAQRVDITDYLKTLNFKAACWFFDQISGQGLVGDKEDAVEPPSKKFKYAIQGNPEPGHRSW